MKKYLLMMLLSSAFLTQSCMDEDSPGMDYNIENSLPPYVTITSTAARTVVKGQPAVVAFSIRTGIQQEVTVTYSVTGGITLANQTVKIPRNGLTVNASIPTTGATGTTATLTLLSAKTADGKDLTI